MPPPRRDGAVSRTTLPTVNTGAQRPCSTWSQPSASRHRIRGAPVGASTEGRRAALCAFMLPRDGPTPTPTLPDRAAAAPHPPDDRTAPPGSRNGSTHPPNPSALSPDRHHRLCRTPPHPLTIHAPPHRPTRRSSPHGATRHTRPHRPTCQTSLSRPRRQTPCPAPPAKPPDPTEPPDALPLPTRQTRQARPPPDALPLPTRQNRQARPPPDPLPRPSRQTRLHRPPTPCTDPPGQTLPHRPTRQTLPHRPTRQTSPHGSSLSHVGRAGFRPTGRVRRVGAAPPRHVARRRTLLPKRTRP